MDEIDLAQVRRSYELGGLREETIVKEPVEQLRVWLQDAQEASAPEHNAMCLCTSRNDRPSARIVLLRGLSERGLVFFTSYFSRKGRELEQNPHACGVFFWPVLERQVRVEGRVDQLPEDESDAYFASRPRGHQLGAWASEQSEPVESREILDQRMQDYGDRFEDEPVPRPHSWGGFVLKPARFEFWQGRPNRMHDRIELIWDTGQWHMRRLQP